MQLKIDKSCESSSMPNQEAPVSKLGIVKLGKVAGKVCSIEFVLCKNVLLAKIQSSSVTAIIDCILNKEILRIGI